MPGAFNLEPSRATDTAVAERPIQPRERTKGQHCYQRCLFPAPSANRPELAILKIFLAPMPDLGAGLRSIKGWIAQSFIRTGHVARLLIRPDLGE